MALTGPGKRIVVEPVPLPAEKPAKEPVTT